jgi:hypothetical protein
MTKFLIALSSGLLVGISSAAFAQSTTAPVGATAPTSTTSSALTPTIANPVITNNATTSQSSSQLPSFLVQSPLETIRIDPAAPSGLRLVIGPTNANTAVLNGDVLTSSTPPATGLAPNAFLGQNSTPGLTMPAAPSATSPSFYPSALAVPTSTATFLSQFQGGLTGIGVTTGSTLPPTVGARGSSASPGTTSPRGSMGTITSSPGSTFGTARTSSRSSRR